MDPLFRLEAVEHRRQRLLGTIVLRQGWPVQVLVALLLLLVAGLLFVFFSFGFARRETLAGRLLPASGLVQATTGESGRVQQVAVHEGQAVAEGDLLVVLSAERVSERGETGARVARALRERRALLDEEVVQVRRRADLEGASLRRRLAQAQTQLAQLQAGIELQGQRSRLAESQLQRHVLLEGQRAISLQDLDAKRAETLDHAMRLHTLQREAAAQAAQRDALQAELSTLPMRTSAEVARLQRALQEVLEAEAENDTRARWEVRAPRAGVVAMVAVEPGQSVAAGSVLSSIAQEGAVAEAVLYAPSRAAGQLRAGMRAQLRFDALPYQKYGQFPGVVREVSRAPVPAGEAAGLVAADAAAGALYRVRVQLDGRAMPAGIASALKVGTQLQATLTLEHRRFYEWVLEPLLGARGRWS